MKKFISALLSLLLIFSIAGCTNAPAGKVEKGENDIEAPKTPAVQEKDPLSEVQEEISADGKLLGVAYLGFVEYDSEFNLAEFKKQDHVKALPFIEDIYSCVGSDGYRVYAIVPADNQVKITVSKCEFDENYMPRAGEELINANGPVLVKGNVSDTIPDLYIVATKGDVAVEYTPVLSGMDGRLENSEDKVYDLTPYDKMAEFGGVDRLPDAVFCGSWIAFENVLGEERVLLLDIRADGTLEYAYGIGNSEVLEQFEGTWELDGDMLKFFMEGGVIDSMENPVVLLPYDCNPTFTWEITADGLNLTHTDGDEILFGTKGKTFNFMAAEEEIYD